MDTFTEHYNWWSDLFQSLGFASFMHAKNHLSFWISTSYMQICMECSKAAGKLMFDTVYIKV